GTPETRPEKSKDSPDLAPPDTFTKKPPQTNNIGQTPSLPVAPVTHIKQKVTNIAQKNIALELRIVWVTIALLALSWFLLLLHFLLPFSALRFLAKGSSALLYPSAAALLFISGMRFFFGGQSIGGTIYTGLLWFGFVALSTHLLRKRNFPELALTAFPLLLIVIVALVWALLGVIPLQEVKTPAIYRAWLFSLSQFFLYTSFGVLATAGSWLLISGYLKPFAKRGRGKGYGLHPESWNQLQLQPGMMVLIAFPLLTLAWVLRALWSLQTFGTAWYGWSTQPRVIAGFVTWLLLSAYLFALRLPKKKALLDSPDSYITRTNRFPSFLLLIATLGGAALFVGAGFLTRLLVG
ncbi:hypothetical protein D6783_05860, partial [Candidatus Woesearchaeota archaeon]